MILWSGAHRHSRKTIWYSRSFVLCLVPSIAPSFIFNKTNNLTIYERQIDDQPMFNLSIRYHSRSGIRTNKDNVQYRKHSNDDTASSNQKVMCIQNSCPDNKCASKPSYYIYSYHRHILSTQITDNSIFQKTRLRSGDQFRITWRKLTWESFRLMFSSHFHHPNGIDPGSIIIIAIVRLPKSLLFLWRNDFVMRRRINYLDFSNLIVFIQGTLQ
jgi:hypothetical protein